MKNNCTCNQHKDYIACCEDVFRALNDCKYGLMYRKYDRAHLWKSPVSKGVGHTIKCCPWCGTMLPPHLGDEWDSVIEKEYSLDPTELYVKDAPAEMQTDEWWKKRGL